MIKSRPFMIKIHKLLKMPKFDKMAKNSLFFMILTYLLAVAASLSNLFKKAYFSI